MKLTFMGAGSTVFARKVIGDCMCSEALRDSVFALYDIDAKRLEESRVILEAIRKDKGSYGKIECYHGIENRKDPHHYKVACHQSFAVISFCCHISTNPF
jgi:alpha-galactosidase